MTQQWDLAWQLQLPGGTATELLSALVIRDLLNGSSYDVEVEGSGSNLAIDLSAGDELDDDRYFLLITAEVEGPEDSEALMLFFEELMDEILAEAEQLVDRSRELGAIASAELVFRCVPEEEERWDLVVPDWLAPDGAEVPFGFRPQHAATGDDWPDNSTLDSHGRVVLVPDGDHFRLIGIPAPDPDLVTLTPLTG